MHSQSSKIAVTVVITAIVVGGGVYIWQKQLNNVEQPQNTRGSLIESDDSQVVPENFETTYSGDTYQITYPKGWTHVGSENGDDYFFKGDVPSDAQVFNSKQTSLAIVEPPSATDQGMCLTKISEKTLTTINGLSFDLIFNANDKNEEACSEAFDHDFVQVFIGNSMNKWMYFTYLPTDTQAEKDLENLLQSIRVK
jgi:hypothetical protein